MALMYQNGNMIMYVKRANEVADGAYVSKWEHEWKLERVATHTMNCKNGSQLDLENKLDTIKRIANYG